jgi:hypothetical protein
VYQARRLPWDCLSLSVTHFGSFPSKLPPHPSRPRRPVSAECHLQVPFSRTPGGQLFPWSLSEATGSRWWRRRRRDEPGWGRRLARRARKAAAQAAGPARAGEGGRAKGPGYKTRRPGSRHRHLQVSAPGPPPHSPPGPWAPRPSWARDAGSGRAPRGPSALAPQLSEPEVLVDILQAARGETEAGWSPHAPPAFPQPFEVT